MKKIIKQLLVFYFLMVLFKILLSSLIPSPSVFSDDYVYMRMARSFFFDFSFNIQDKAIDIYPPLYPILLSISYIFKDMTFSYFFMKIINALVSSLVIIPSYLFSREFFNEKKSLIISLLISIIPSNFSLTPYIISENLFYPLFLFTVYFIYKSFSYKGYKYNILGGIFLALLYLTRTIAVGLVAAFFVSYIILFVIKKADRFEIFKKFILSVSLFAIIISPWMIRNFSLYGFDLKLFFGPNTKSVLRVASGFNFFNNLLKFFIYGGYLILASLVIFPLKLTNIIFNKKNKDFLILFLPLLFMTLFIAANHGSRPIFFEWFTGRYIGRYVDFLLPLIYLGGFLGVTKVKKLNKYFLFIFVFLLSISSLLTLHSLFPVNNLSLTWVGIIKYVFEFIFYNKISYNIEFFIGSLLFFTLFFVSLLFLIIFLERKFSLKKLIPYIFIFFLLLNSLNYGINYYDSKVNFYDKEQMQLGLWLNKYDSNKVSNILFDEESCGHLIKSYQKDICGGTDNLKTMIGYWLNDNIIVGSVNNLEGIDYVISKQVLNLSLIKESKEDIYIYEIVK